MCRDRRTYISTYTQHTDTRTFAYIHGCSRNTSHFLNYHLRGASELIQVVKSKVSAFSPGRPEGSLFNSYYIKV